MINIGYYPGCALHGSSNDYEQSVRNCLAKLEVSLKEIDDWICCGASGAHMINKKLGTALPLRNLAIAERDGVAELLAPCPLCSMELLKAKQKITADELLRREMSEIVELPLAGSCDVLNLVQIFQKVGFDNIIENATVKLEGFKPACYYGCLMVRPPRVVQFDDPEHPNSMETLLAGLGAEPVHWNYQTECCGAGLTLADGATVERLVGKILKNAKEHGATCMVAACPMCIVNLDMKQSAAEKRLGESLHLPVYSLSDLVGLALGLSKKELAINKHFVEA
ncbi:MAG: CoB--CoM heterodisulfide reductase iron-sulfur subunit B family protein [Planctomycetaceae bacterium]|jgi:heterodisulfide reductase subunit B|nr:CoB--CoM heterodisulfide reductase iron-sulfur subunit B family protein [Planctomycetaceae bacterium]